jgi:hypothetical protein
MKNSRTSCGPAAADSLTLWGLERDIKKVSLSLPPTAPPAAMKFNYKQQRTTRANSAASALARKQASISNQNYTTRVALLKFLLGS